MMKIMFVCHGNICRSPMAEFIFKDLAAKQGAADKLVIASSATSAEEIWNGIGNPVSIQVEIIDRIKKQQFFSFSSPTSTGKSFVFRYVINMYSNDIVIIVPSRALINEYYNLVVDLVDIKVVNVLTFVDLINTKRCKRNIFIMTPERTKDLFILKDKLNVDTLY